jgi:hypothetical protein
MTSAACLAACASSARSSATRSFSAASVGRDLVVARARGVQPLAGVAGQRRQPLLDVEVDVLGVDRPGKGAGRDLAPDPRHALLDCGEVLLREDAARGQHPGVRERRRDVMLRQPLVERDGSGKALNLFVDGLREAAGPGLRLLRHNV